MTKITENWFSIHPDFATKSWDKSYQQLWIEQGFSKEQVRQYLDQGFTVQDFMFLTWLRSNQQIVIKQLNKVQITQLKKDYRQLWVELDTWFAEKSWSDSEKTYQQIWEEEGVDYNRAKEWNQLSSLSDSGAICWPTDWIKRGFTSTTTQLWLAIGLKIDESELATYARRKRIKPNSDLNLEQLREEFQPIQDYLDFFLAELKSKLDQSYQKNSELQKELNEERKNNLKLQDRLATVSNGLEIFQNNWKEEEKNYSQNRKSFQGQTIDFWGKKNELDRKIIELEEELKKSKEKENALEKNLKKSKEEVNKLTKKFQQQSSFLREREEEIVGLKEEKEKNGKERIEIKKNVKELEERGLSLEAEKEELEKEQKNLEKKNEYLSESLGKEKKKFKETFREQEAFADYLNDWIIKKIEEEEELLSEKSFFSSRRSTMMNNLTWELEEEVESLKETLKEKLPSFIEKEEKEIVLNFQNVNEAILNLLPFINQESINQRTIEQRNEEREKNKEEFNNKIIIHTNRPGLHRGYLSSSSLKNEIISDEDQRTYEDPTDVKRKVNKYEIDLKNKLESVNWQAKVDKSKAEAIKVKSLFFNENDSEFDEEKMKEDDPQFKRLSNIIESLYQEGKETIERKKDSFIDESQIEDIEFPDVSNKWRKSLDQSFKTASELEKNLKTTQEYLNYERRTEILLKEKEIENLKKVGREEELKNQENLNQVQKENTELITKNNNLQEQNTLLQTENSQLESEKSKLETDKADLEKEVVNKNQAVQDLQEENQTLAKDKKSIENQLGTSKGQIDQLTNNYKAEKQKREKTQQDLNNLDDNYKSLNKDIQTTEQKVQALASEKFQLEQSLSQIQQINSKIKNDLLNKEQELIATKEDLATVKREMVDKDKTIDKLSKKEVVHAQVKQNLEERTEEYENLEKSLEIQKTQWKKSENDFQDQIKQLSSKLENLQIDLEKKNHEKEFKSLEREQAIITKLIIELRLTNCNENSPLEDIIKAIQQLLTKPANNNSVTYFGENLTKIKKIDAKMFQNLEIVYSKKIRNQIEQANNYQAVADLRQQVIQATLTQKNNQFQKISQKKTQLINQQQNERIIFIALTGFLAIIFLSVKLKISLKKKKKTTPNS